MNAKNNVSTNQQDHPHREGQTMNTPSQQGGAGQRGDDNNSQGMSDMMNDSEEQKAGRGQDQQDEGDVQQEQRQP